MPNKRGAISKKEEQFLKDNYKTLSPAEIADELGRTEEIVKQWMITILKLDPDEKLSQEQVERIAIEKEFMKSPDWEALREEFSEEELKFFKHRYAKYMAQFRKDVWATEEAQVFMLIRYEILQHRNLTDTQRSMKDIERLEKMLQDIYDSYTDTSSMDDQTKNMVLSLENQILAAKTARQAKSSEYVKLTEKISMLMKDLKSTRDQRLSKIDDLDGTLLDLFKRLQQEEVAEREGRHIALVDLAVNKERERLGQLHKYADGTIDQPLLTPENILDEEVEEREQEEEVEEYEVIR